MESAFGGPGQEPYVERKTLFSIVERQQINDVFAMMQERIYEWGKDKGWNVDLNDRTFGDWCSLFQTEISEAYEEYRNHHDTDEIWWDENFALKDANEGLIQKPEGIPIEIADAAIRFLHFFAYLGGGLNLGNCIVLKMDYNSLRPYRHGNKRI